MTTKELVKQLYKQMIHDLSVSNEQLEMIIKLYHSFETLDEREQRKQDFHNWLNNRLDADQKDRTLFVQD